MKQREYRRALEKGIGKIAKQLKKQKYKCLYPDCKTIAIKSHSQQKERQLRNISENGCVYSIVRNHYQALKNTKSTSIIGKQGISAVSTFPGYCSKHDRELFKHIDKGSITFDV